MGVSLRQAVAVICLLIVMNIDTNAVLQNATAVLTQVGLKVVGALILWLVGRTLIRFASRLTGHALARQSVDSTIASYIRSSIDVVLNIALVVALLGFFGVETTTFAALLAGVGLAVGAAWSGLLSNFASGIFLIVLRPFKVGDMISAAGVTGVVRTIGLFGTSIDTADNIHTIIGNSKILGDNIQNFTVNPYRRVDLLAQLSGNADHQAGIALLKQGLAAIPNVMKSPAPEVTILTFNMSGPVLAVRPYCHNDNYWQVYFDANKLIKEALTGPAFPAAHEVMVIRSQAAGA